MHTHWFLFCFFCVISLFYSLFLSSHSGRKNQTINLQTEASITFYLYTPTQYVFLAWFCKFVVSSGFYCVFAGTLVNVVIPRPRPNEAAPGVGKAWIITSLNLIFHFFLPFWKLIFICQLIGPANMNFYFIPVISSYDIKNFQNIEWNLENLVPFSPFTHFMFHWLYLVRGEFIRKEASPLSKPKCYPASNLS